MMNAVQTNHFVTQNTQHEVLDQVLAKSSAPSALFSCGFQAIRIRR